MKSGGSPPGSRNGSEASTDACALNRSTVLGARNYRVWPEHHVPTGPKLAGSRKRRCASQSLGAPSRGCRWRTEVISSQLCRVSRRGWQRPCQKACGRFAVADRAATGGWCFVLENYQREPGSRNAVIQQFTRIAALAVGAVSAIVDSEQRCAREAKIGDHPGCQDPSLKGNAARFGGQR